MKTVTNDPLLTETSLFRVSLAQTADHLTDCQRLRYSVFNEELGEGLSTSERDHLDIDPFDNFCDHLMVTDLESGRLVGTYRLQTGEVARKNLGYYGNQIFDFSVYEPIRKEMLELGRACVHVDFRNIMVLHALWKGIAVYATRHESRYLIGCSSVTSQDENYGMAMYDALKENISSRPRSAPIPNPVSVANPAEIPSNPLARRASSAPISKSPAASAGRRPSIANSRPSIFSPSSIWQNCPTASAAASSNPEVPPARVAATFRWPAFPSQRRFPKDASHVPWKHVRRVQSSRLATPVPLSRTNAQKIKLDGARAIRHGAHRNVASPHPGGTRHPARRFLLRLLPGRR